MKMTRSRASGKQAVKGQTAGWLSVRRKRAREVLSLLGADYPAAKCALDFGSPEELLVATVLSAQCTDAMVNRVTPELFRRFAVPEGLAHAPLREIQSIIRQCGYYRQKSKFIRGACSELVSHHGGKVPRSLEELVLLPGVARKTANVVLSVAFDINEGVAVDTHVARLSRRLGLSRSNDPVGIEKDLMRVAERADWGKLTTLLIAHGRAVCTARKPACTSCSLKGVCPSAFRV